jgi:hypothetical protein
MKDSTNDKEIKKTLIILTKEQIADLKNESAAVFKSSDNSEYNYSKIAENLRTVCDILQINLSNEFENQIQKDKNNFITCKTKPQLSNYPEYSRLKGKIRKQVRLFLFNKKISDNSKSLLKKLIF